MPSGCTWLDRLLAGSWPLGAGWHGSPLCLAFAAPSPCGRLFDLAEARRTPVPRATADGVPCESRLPRGEHDGIDGPTGGGPRWSFNLRGWIDRHVGFDASADPELQRLDRIGANIASAAEQLSDPAIVQAITDASRAEASGNLLSDAMLGHTAPRRNRPSKVRQR